MEAKFAEIKAPFTQEEFQKQLASRKMSVEDMKAQLKRDLRTITSRDTQE